MIRILFASANPVGTDYLSLDEELRRIQGRIRASDDRADFDLRSIWATRPDDLLRQMNDFRPDILHVSGRGSQVNEIMLEDSDGEIKPVSKETLRALFRNHLDQPYVVVLNACYSQQQVEELVDEVAVVVGIDEAIDDRAAIAFAASFYRALGFNRTIHEAFEQGLASIQLEDEGAHARIPILHHNDSVDPRVLTVETLPAAVTAWHRAEDINTPERIAGLLREGAKLIKAPSDLIERTPQRSNPRLLMLELGARQSASALVVEVDDQMQIGSVATHLARHLLPAKEVPAYHWTLVRDGVPLRDSHTFEFGGIESGARVALIGSHLAAATDQSASSSSRPADAKEIDSEIAVNAYLDTDDVTIATRVFEALDKLAAHTGYLGPLDETILRGSFFRKARARIIAGLTTDEVRNRLIKLERAVELRYLDAEQAEVDQKIGAVVAELISALDGVPQACLRVGSILLIKYSDGPGPVLLVRTLSQPEIRALERFPEIQMKPSVALEALTSAVLSLEP